MQSALADILKELIEGGFIGQAFLGSLVWGVIAFLLLTQKPVPDKLFDAGLIILGAFFNSVQAAATRARNTRDGPA